MSAREQLEQMEKLRAEGTPGPWRIGMESCDCGGGYPCGHPDYPYELDGPKRAHPNPSFPEYDNLVSEVGDLTHADAALIVAAVNALEKHTAALRAVLELHVPIRENGDDIDWCAACTTAWPCLTSRAITEALDHP